jgi:hypothetical protein
MTSGLPCIYYAGLMSCFYSDAVGGRKGRKNLRTAVIIVYDCAGAEMEIPCGL